MSVTPSHKIDSFWKWFLFGSQKSIAGLYCIWNKFLIVHCVIGLLLTILVRGDPYIFAGKALFAAASIVIGVALAWTTRAASILQSSELREKLFSPMRPVEDYIYGFQVSILVIFMMICYVAIMAAGGLNLEIFGSAVDVGASKFFMYFMISISIRECWGAVNFTNILTILEFRRDEAAVEKSKSR